MDRRLLASVLWKISHHLDGIAISSTVWALARKGVFGRLACARAPLDVSALAAEVGCREGYFHLAVKLLADQGLVRRIGDIRRGETRVVLSRPGVEWLGLLQAYDQTPRVIELALAFPAWLAGQQKGEPKEFRRLVDGVGTRPTTRMGERVHLHIQGFLVAAVFTELAEKGIVGGLRPEDSVDPAELGTADKCEDVLREPQHERSQSPSNQGFSAHPERPVEGCLKRKSTVPLQGDAEALDAAFELLAAHGWAARDGRRWSLTPEGDLARLAAPQYLPAMAYLAMFRQVPRMLAGSELEAMTPAGDGIERHIDRRRDVAFSGQVFSATHRERFLDLALPLFRTQPLAVQPRGVVDIGSGDGTLLRELFQAVRDHTARGQKLDEYPLLMVGVDCNRLPREATAATLSAAGVPNLVIPGDIDDPEGVAEELARHGIDPRAVLYVSKSVVHNRAYRPPCDQRRVAGWEPLSTAVFVAPDGGLIPARELECNLVEHFERWARWTGIHGMIVMETHTVDPSRLAGRIGMSVITGLDASHGYSHQYPVELEVFHRAAQAAGFVSSSSRQFGQDIVGHHFLSIDHFFPRHASG